MTGPGDGLPTWWDPLADRLRRVRAEDLSRHVPPPDNTGRPSAVLMLLADRPDRPADDAVGADVLLMERAATMRSHAGQPAFPGGGTEPGDRDMVGTALREAQEEVGLDPASVRVVAEMPALWLPPSGYVVTPVVAWWAWPHPVGVADPAEVARVARVPLAELADPANRFRVRHPSGYVGPAFTAGGMLIWGFTAGLLSAVLDLGGWSRPWREDRVEDLPRADVERALRTSPPDAVH
ncbi:MAG TPA: CoA pyrophosphatase [Cryptosporangiaceae bacterium]|nr:CoA pyrophosphatase [Cryptosporangiaceae bacterium]